MAVNRMHWRFLSVWLSVSAISFTAHGHTLPISFLTIVPDSEYLHLELTFNPFELTFASELDQNKNGRIDPSEWERQQGAVAARILECLKLDINHRRQKAEVFGITPDLDSHHATLRAHYRVDARGQEVRLESDLSRITSASHLTEVTFSSEGQQQRAQLDVQSKIATFEPGRAGDPQPVRARPVHPGHGERTWILCIGLLVMLVATAGWWVGRASATCHRVVFNKSPSPGDVSEKPL